MVVWYRHLPLYNLKTWAPFKIDALGLVTLLGQEQVNAKIGRLVREGYLDFMPLLGAFVIAGNLFSDRQAGFSIYNITSGIVTPELAGWFTRWLKAQDFDKNKMDIKWIVEAERRSYAKMNWIAFIIAFTFQAGFLALAISMGDWYGIANFLSMALSVLVRVYVLNENRDAIDLAIARATEQALLDQQKDPTKTPMREVTVLCILDDATAVIMKTPQYLITSCFVATPKPPHQASYRLVRSLGWIFFLVHIITIGQSDLISQMITVVLLVVPTVVMVALPEKWRRWLGCNESYIGKRLTAQKTPTKARGTRRAHLYAMCQLTRKEEESMLSWSTMPHASNVPWWDDYKGAKQEYLLAYPEERRIDPDNLPLISNQATNTQLIPPLDAAIPISTHNIHNARGNPTGNTTSNPTVNPNTAIQVPNSTA
jgi:hypothetical protein